MQIVAINRTDATAILDCGTIIHFATMLDIDVFSNVSVPEYLRACHTLPHFHELSPDRREDVMG